MEINQDINWLKSFIYLSELCSTYRRTSLHWPLQPVLKNCYNFSEVVCINTCANEIIMSPLLRKHILLKKKTQQLPTSFHYQQSWTFRKIALENNSLLLQHRQYYQELLCFHTSIKSIKWEGEEINKWTEDMDVWWWGKILQHFPAENAWGNHF